MAMQSLRKGASTGFLKYILMGLLLFAAGGLVMTDVGGFFRGGISSTDIGKAGHEKINISSFDRTLRRTLSRIGIAPEEAFKLGYIDELLNGEIRGALMNQTAIKLGIYIDKEHTAARIRTIVEPMVKDGGTPQQVLDQVLISQGMSEREFVNSINRETGTSLLNAAILGGAATVSENMTADIYAFQSESRNIDVVFFPDSELKDIMEPSDAQLAALYEAMKENYAKAETRSVTLITINDKKLRQTIDISEEELRAAYDENITAYTMPEQRSIEQAILPSEDEANAVFQMFKTTGNLMTAVKQATNAESSYLKPQNFEKEGLLPEISETAFNAPKGNVAGPVQTALGWHVLVVNDIIRPTTKSFEQVRKTLEDEIKQVRLAEQLYELANAVDDLMAGGATLEDVRKEVDIETKSLPSFNSYGQGKDGKDALSEHENHRNLILETAYQLSEGETSPVMETPDSGFMAVHVDKIQQKSYTPFEEVKGEIKTKWHSDQRHLENKMRVSELLAEIESTGKSLKDFTREKGKSVKSLGNIKRQDEPQRPLTQAALNIAFEAQINSAVLVDTTEGSAIVQVTGFAIPKEVKDKKEIEELQAALTRAGQNETPLLYIQNKHQAYGVVVNRDLLHKLYGPGRESF